ncbi:MAG: phosphoribosylanthranilate isomerase [Peptococcaceae bacterium]|nr:phosphoribosylanthranilate isomerase [Peptococcaceae bacterium]
MTRVKFCGLRREEDIATANALMPDDVGFVFAAKSKRCLTPEAARALKAQLAPAIRAVGVLVDMPVRDAAALVNSGIVDVLQLHGHEDEDYIQRLRALTLAPIIQAFAVRSVADLARAEASSADIILLDAARAGSGETFDWNLLAQVRRPYYLAGGLNLDNIATAVRTLHPYAVDVSSGIETDGCKDAEKMAAFIQIVRSNAS